MVSEKKGSLKIFLGMAPGVGKTLTMLKAATVRFQAGMKVAVGIVDSLDDDENIALVNQLPQINHLHYDSGHKDLDVDEIIRHKPDLVIIDRLEHINSPTVRYRFRYQDVEELLAHGISVFTTLNIHHIDGLLEVVFQVTGVRCSEIVPERLFDQADEVELVDMPVDELLEKYRNGNIVLPDYLRALAPEFYRKSNIIALREIALRRLARRVNCELTEYLNARPGEAKTLSREGVGAIIGTSPDSEQVIRAANRLASDRDMPLIAIHIQQPRMYTPEEQRQINRCISLVGELGGEMSTAIENDMVSCILRIAHEKNVSHLFVGNHTRTPGIFGLGSRWVARDLITRSGAIHVSVIKQVAPMASMFSKFGFFSQSLFNDKLRLGQYLLSLAVSLSVAAACFFAGTHIDYHSVGIVLLLAITCLSLFFRGGPILVAGVSNALIWDVLFIPPRFALVPSHPEDLLVVGLFIAVAIIFAYFTAAVQKKETMLRQQVYRTSQLVAFMKEILLKNSVDDVVMQTINHIRSIFKADVSFHVLADDKNISLTCHPASTWIPSRNEDTLAMREALHTRMPVGNRFTTAEFFPLSSSSRMEGIIGLKNMQSMPFSIDDQTLLLLIINQAATALEKQRLRLKAEKAIAFMESERLYQTLFNSLSHALRTPLSTICGAASNLANDDTAHNDAIRTTLVADISSSADRLNRLVTNLFDMSRIESGHLKVKLEWCDIVDIVDSLLQSHARLLANHSMHVTIEENFPLLKIDSVLIAQVILNILENAVNNSPAGSRIFLHAYLDATIPAVSFEDEGPGFPTDSLPRLWEKFYRVPNSPYAGTGLGLSIAKTLITAHGGTIEASNRNDKGATIVIRFPLTLQTLE